MPTVDAGTIPFRILDLLGKREGDLPGRRSWARSETPAGAPPSHYRLTYRGTGRESGRPVEVEIAAEIVDEHVAAVALSTPDHVGTLEHPPDAPPYFCAAPRSPGMDLGLRNWIVKADGGFVERGLSP